MQYKEVPEQDTLNAAVETWGKGSDAEPGEHRAQMHERAASMYNQVGGAMPNFESCFNFWLELWCMHDSPDVCLPLQIWGTANASLADKIMTKDVKIYNVLFASKKSGIDTFKSMIDGIFKVRFVCDKYADK